jgi:signal transduction histidine kinase
VEVAAFRIVTEAVTNVVRHASASSVEVEVEVHAAVEPAGRTLRVTVRDDGVGVDPGDVGSGHGLDSMRERAEELNGSLRWDTSPGTAVIAELPLALSVPAEPSGERVAAGRARTRADAPVLTREAL